MKKNIFKITLLLFAFLVLAVTYLHAEGDNGSAKGATKDTAVVLIPLPFDQEGGEFTLDSKDDVVWFLFYANKGQSYVFEFVGEEGEGMLNAELYGAKDSPDLTQEKELKGGKTLIVAFKGESTGNHYIKISVGKKSLWKGKLTYAIKELPES